jgi:two-component system, response regulator YesN
MDELSNLIIVDDEAIIREGLRDMVDWESLGFRVGACFEDGVEALDYMALNSVDAVLTDIMMNDVNGIDLAKFVSENYPGVRVVILSGYRNFEFAQQAIRYDAWRYLLKPVDFHELGSVFNDLRRDIVGVAPDISKSMLESSRRQLFLDVVSGNIGSADELADRVQRSSLGIHINEYPCALITMDIEDAGEATQTTTIRTGILRSLATQRTDILFEEISTFGDRSVLFATSIDQQAKEKFQVNLALCLQRTTETIRSAFRVSVKTDIVFVAESLLDVLNAPPKGIENALRERRHPSALSDDPVLRRIEVYLAGNFAADISLSDVAARAFLSPVYFSKYFKDKTGVTFSDYLSQLRVNRAIELLRENRLKIREIGDRVGYPNPRYFSRVFKRRTGYSPREYCARILAMEL